MAEVKLEEVGKVYPGNVRAVGDVNLQIADGEFVVLVGPSGCGKSTTLRMIAGLEDVTEGTISIGSRVVNELAPKDRDIAMVFQNYALYPHMTVFENMAFGLKLRKSSKSEIQARVTHVAKQLMLEELLERKPKALSGGQRQRVALGRAIVREPAAFLFDEPLSNLDAKLRVETRAELKRLHQRLKTTTIYVTHDQEEAMTLGDRIVVMSQGKVQQVDAPLTVYERPQNRFVASFLGTPPMNFVDGTLINGDLGVRFEGAGLSILLPSPTSERLRGEIGRPVVLGVRPEFFSPIDDAPKGPIERLSFRVEVVEPLGHLTDLYLSGQGDARLVARIRSVSVSPNDSIELQLSTGKLHVFAPGDYGQNLSLL
ncbi:MAG: sn-glycerol-3-phosphate ABC transporter ATP-binding protein UgpC [Polyangiaceae bacterium]|nr:sn-glycerol-3-phosphate ABC transporter ATP-binding protein UgpC [Polyangiaceae bacterium]